MRWDRLLIVAALVLGAAWTSPASAHSSLQVDVGFFYNDLAPYGSWYQTNDYGWVWNPHVQSGWRPYTSGHWLWTDDYGWYWASGDPYGWAVYHYGRWAWDPAIGWAWVPGTEWAPAWVSYRSGGGYVGWAPLSPQVGWNVGVGFRVGAVGMDAFIAPHQYNFVDERYFLDGNVGRRVVPMTRNAALISGTRNITNFDARGGRVVNRSLSVDNVERFTRRHVPRTSTVEVASVRDARSTRVRGDRVEVFRPEVRRAADRATPPQGRRLGRSLDRGDRNEPLATTRERDREQERSARLTDRQAAQRREADRQRELDRRREADRTTQSAEAERLQRQREAERRQTADRERQREADRQVRADRERQAQSDRERQVRADRERQAQSDRERQVRADRERQAQADRQRQVERARREDQQRIEGQRADQHRRDLERQRDAERRAQVQRAERQRETDRQRQVERTRLEQQRRTEQQQQQRERERIQQRDQSRKESEAQKRRADEKRAAERRAADKKKKESEKEKPP